MQKEGEHMSTQTASILVEARPAQAGNLVFRTGLFVLFLICGVAIFVFGSNYFTVFPTNENLAYNTVLSAGFLVAAVWLKRNERLAKYWQVAFAFFIASFAFLFTLFFGGLSDMVLGWFNLTTTTSQGIAIAKVSDVVMIVVPIIVLTKLSGADLGALYIKRGNLKWCLGIGTLVLFNFAASAFLFFATRYTSMDKLGAAVLWGLVFSFANSFMEELWLRGIFLKRFEPLLGLGGAVLVTSIVFSLMHVGAVYLTPAAIPFMLANTLTMGLACGYLIMKTNSIWGATLIHAASDLFLFIAMLANA
jgi:membrane protease YdiL (CAAX protease family)